MPLVEDTDDMLVNHHNRGQIENAPPAVSDPRNEERSRESARRAQSPGRRERESRTKLREDRQKKRGTTPRGFESTSASLRAPDEDDAPLLYFDDNQSGAAVADKVPPALSCH